jgi:hypothetical protein
VASKLDLGLCLFRLAYGCSAGAGEVLLWARWDGEARVPLAGEAGALLDGQGGPTVDPYGGSGEWATTIYLHGFARQNIGKSRVLRWLAWAGRYKTWWPRSVSAWARRFETSGSGIVCFQDPTA